MLSKTEKTLLWASNLSGFGMGLLGPLYAVFAQKVGGDVMELSVVYAVYLILMGLGIVVVGNISDRLGYEKILVTGYMLRTLGTFSYLFVDSMLSLLFVQIVLGIASALVEPTWYALYDKNSGDGKRDGYIWGLSSGMWFVSSGLAVIVGGYIVSVDSFETLFTVMGTIMLISTVYLSRILFR
jgi:MFS family permease